MSHATESSWDMEWCPKRRTVSHGVCFGTSLNKSAGSVNYGHEVVDIFMKCLILEDQFGR